MPNRTIYIRKEDLDKWEAIEDKPTWLQIALNGTDVPTVNKVIKERKEIEKIMEQHLPIITERNKDMDFCKHGSVKGFCKKGCK
jgi:hypothetical protein